MKEELEIVLASWNEGKRKEFAEALAPLGVKLVSLADVNFSGDLSEGSSSYRENALAKARVVGRVVGKPAIADDSGLEVEALGGEPGVFSNRFLGSEATPEERNEEILRRLADVPEGKRGARFRCVIAFCESEGEEKVVEGVCEGRIADAPRGQGGFGYDPIFEVEGLGKTMAELSLSEKNRLSHRGRAIRELVEVLRGDC